MLSKKRRVSRKLFDEVFPKTRIYSTDFFTIRYATTEEERETRFSIIVSKKVSSKAVRRNFIKRRIASVLKSMESGIKNSYIVLIFCKKKTLDASFGDLREEIIRALGHIQALKRM